jgi:hypothetical protein
MLALIVTEIALGASAGDGRGAAAGSVFGATVMLALSSVLGVSRCR